MMLHWEQTGNSNISSTFDLIVASDWYVLPYFRFSNKNAVIRARGWECIGQ